jgi:hypothetical protein
VAFRGAGIPLSQLLLVPLTVDNAEAARDDWRVAGVVRRCTGIWFPGGAPYRIASVLYGGGGGKGGVAPGVTGFSSWVMRGGVRGRAVQLDAMKPTLKPTGTKRLIHKFYILLSTSAFKINLRRYSGARRARWWRH